jgi:hypothetical protein
MFQSNSQLGLGYRKDALSYNKDHVEVALS